MNRNYISDMRKEVPQASSTVRLPCNQSDPSMQQQYYVQPRNIPHSKIVHHIKGLNDAPICCVKDDGLYSRKPYDASNLTLPERDLLLRYLQPLRGRGLENNLYPLHTISGLPTVKDRGGGLSRASLLDEPLNSELQQLPDRTRHAGMFSKKAKAEEESSKRNNLSTPGTPSSRAQNRRSMHCSSGSFRNYSDDTQHLDYEFNFLLKLFDILQTDSLTDIQHWLKMATSKERECVSEMIRSVLDMEFNNQQEPAGEYAKKKKKLQDNMNGIKTTEAGPAGAAQHTRPASQIIQARLSRKQENDKDAKQHVPVWSHTAPALGSSRRVIPPSRPRTQEQIRKPAIGFSGKVHVRYSTPSMSAAKPSPGRNSNESRASMDHARKAPVVRCSTQTHTR